TSTGFPSFSVNGTSCSTPNMVYTIAAGQSTVSLYYEDSVIGTPTVAMAGPANLTIATQVEKVTSTGMSPIRKLGAPTQLVFVTSPRTLQPQICASAGTVQVEDANGNPVNPGPIAYTVLSSSSLGELGLQGATTT